MADYRLSAQVISRGKGQSCVASAAYRAASRLMDERTGEAHDYTRKQGVSHTEILAPDNTPEWMFDRDQLWNAVEAVERRKDAQLAREIQLSLPHELDAEQRKELVRDFVQEQFVDRGMIADLAIHDPGKNGDQRNHHAHVMLTMREMTGGGFGKKNRDWNSSDRLNEWRQEWANHQNRALERAGSSDRVDHRSYEDQGIDREPTQHLGHVANDMENRGKQSRIGDENRDIQQRNSDRARSYAAEFELKKQIDRQKSNFDKWASYERIELDNAHQLTRLDAAQKYDRMRSLLNWRLQEEYGTAKKTIRKEMDTITRRLEAKGVRKVFRDVFGKSQADKERREILHKNLASIADRERQQRAALDVRISKDRKLNATTEKRRQILLERRIDARQRRLKKQWLQKRRQVQNVEDQTPLKPIYDEAKRRQDTPAQTRRPSMPDNVTTTPEKRPQEAEKGKWWANRPESEKSAPERQNKPLRSRWERSTKSEDAKPQASGLSKKWWDSKNRSSNDNDERKPKKPDLSPGKIPNRDFDR